MWKRHTASNPATCNVHDRSPEDDGLKLQNFRYAILLIMSYVMLVLLIGSAMSR